MSEDGDYTPAAWAPTSFTDARRAYDDAHASRSSATSASVPRSAVLETRLFTDAEMPLIIVCDETGSMGEWPAIIFAKFPYLAHEAKEYLGEDHAIAVGAIGDARRGDPQPLQMRPFAKDKGVQDRLMELQRQSGGGNGVESYDLAMLYCLQNVDMPNAVHSILIIISDEGVYDSVSKAHAAEFGIDIDKEMTIEEIADGLKEKYGDVYILRKPYGDERMNGDIHARWASMFGSDHVLDLQDPEAACDVIRGLLAKSTGKVDYFRKEIEGRQGAARVQTVYKALETVHGTPAKAAGKGKTRLGVGGNSKMLVSGTTRKKSDDLA